MPTNVLLNSEVREAFKKYFEKISKNIAETISKSEQKQDNVAEKNF